MEIICMAYLLMRFVDTVLSTIYNQPERKERGM